MASSSVDKRAIEGLVKQLREASKTGPGGTFERIKKLLAAEALTQLQLGFRESRDPYGKSWKPPEHRSGKPLLDTGRLRNSFSFELTPSGFKIGTSVIYARIHQNGGTIVPKKAKSLRIPMAIQGPAVNGAGKKAVGLGTAFIFVKSVKIPQRQMLPIGVLGPIWQKAFNAVAQRELRRRLGVTK